MQSFTINGNQYFDCIEQPVLYAEGGVARYWNQAMSAFGLLYGLLLTEGEPLPAPLAELEAGCVAQLEIGGLVHLVQAQPLGEGTLFTITGQGEREVLGKYETLRLCGKLRTALGESLLALHSLYDSMVETEQLKLEEQFRPLLRQYCRLLRMVGSTELMVQDEEELIQNWEQTPVSLTALADQLHREIEPMNHRFTCQAENGLVVLGNEALLRRALLNLIANALRAEGTVVLRMAASGDFALIEVKNLKGSAMEPQALSGLFGEAQAQNLLSPGGLHFGMQLCWKVFRMHGGTLALLNQPDGLLVRGQLPLLKEGGLPLGSGEDRRAFAGGISDVLVELSDVLESCWYDTGELLD